MSVVLSSISIPSVLSFTAALRLFGKYPVLVTGVSASSKKIGLVPPVRE